MKKHLAVAAVIALGSFAFWYHHVAASDRVKLTTRVVAVGDLMTSVACTGTLQPVETVDVGSEVSGTVSELPVDFNSIVRKGQVLARLDTSTFSADLAQARAAFEKASDDLEAARVAVTDATEKLDRAKALAARQLIPQSDLDDAAVAAKQAAADVDDAAAQRDAAHAAVDQATVNLAHAVIVSPIAGIVVARKVDVGQTIAASFEAPSLFSIAGDLTKMQLVAVVDESDIGRVRVGARARFRVDAYPDEQFDGTVTQVRLDPEVVDKVVSYDTVIAVDNSRLLLKPGMMADITVEVAHRDSVPLIPTEALRFRPTEALLDALESHPPKGFSELRPQAELRPGAAGEVWVAVGDRVEPRRIHVGLSDGPFTEVAEGLAPGARVVTAAAVRSKP